ncbi:MAG: hypothetical protein OXC07_03950 [Kistimonas sp.]|nr:hypothetical protein [Kistimonas sp.]
MLPPTTGELNPTSTRKSGRLSLCTSPCLAASVAADRAQINEKSTTRQTDRLLLHERSWTCASSEATPLSTGYELYRPPWLQSGTQATVSW